MDPFWLLLILPLASAALIQLRLKSNPALSAGVATGSVVVTFVLSLALLGSSNGNSSFKWVDLSGFTLQVGLHLDPLSRGMMFVVTGIGMLVHIFSLGYMRDDEAKARYFCGLSFFMFSMTGIVLADNLIMMFIFWELVGFSSYLLIGHWFRKPAAAEAAKKAFIVNRIGDFGFMAGILMLWRILGSLVFDEMTMPDQGTTLLGVAVLLTFCGAAGKSAQFPLHVWLPDAMEGPSPVSALIHAATMVAAGVYMLFRLQVAAGAQIFAGFAGDTVAWVGALTALLAALMATQQDDIKRILAYSTVSQLGYMIMAVGLGGHTPPGAANLAGQAGLFHLYTHAWFKALLFLAAGAVILSCRHEQNIWKMGGLAKRMRLTTLAFAAATAALIAAPLTSGFFSKEQILEVARHHAPALFWIAVCVALLTAFYMTRLFVVAFLGTPRTHPAEDARETTPVMLIPSLALGFMALASGYPVLAKRLFPAFHDPGYLMHFGFIPGVSIAALLAGAALGWTVYAGRSSDPLASNPLFRLFRNKFFFDELYAKLVRYGQDFVAAIVHFFDEFVINSLFVGGLARTAAGLGDFFRRLQTGNLQGYAILFGAGVLLVVYLTVFAR